MARMSGTSGVSASGGHGSDICELFAEIAGAKADAGPSEVAAVGTGIATLIEAEVIPRLLLIHANETGGSENAPAAHKRTRRRRRCNEEDVKTLSAMVIAADGEACSRFIDRLLRENVELEDILLNLLAPIARRLGSMWEEDELDFLEVTRAVCELQHLLHKVAPASPPVVAKSAPKALFLPVPGEQHSFGLLIVSELFRRDGWAVTSNAPARDSDVSRIVAGSPFEIVGFSLSCELLIPALTSAIRNIKTNSCNPGTRLVVGGHAFEGDPGLWKKVGADYHAPDAQLALEYARSVHAQSVREG